jgi:hypothetical protein
MLVSTALLMLGCVPKQVVRPAYYGPTDNLATLVDKLNARTAKLQTLHAQGTFDADLVDPQTKKRDGGRGDLTLLFSNPNQLRLAGKVLGQRIFDIGSNTEQYWMVLPRQDVMYWGEHASAGKGTGRLPIRPDLLVQVLGFDPIPTDLLKEPAPALRFNNDQDCYMVTWNVLLRDRFAIQKEVWYDRQTLSPRLVLLFDANGRVVLRAYPSEPAKVEGYEQTVEVPTRFDLLFPDTGSTFKIRLDVLRKENDGVPNERTFAFPGERANVARVERLDQ